ncbi:hypothetical protein, partial [Methylomagnum sp.]
MADQTGRQMVGLYDHSPRASNFIERPLSAIPHSLAAATISGRWLGDSAQTKKNSHGHSVVPFSGCRGRIHGAGERSPPGAAVNPMES